MKNVIIAGGGLSGIITGIQLANAGIQCTIIEKKTYPFHRVCGEYVSAETVPFLKSLRIYPEAYAPPSINKVQLTSVNGHSAILPLTQGGFGISRYTFDNFLFEAAKTAGVIFITGIEIESITFHGNEFEVLAAGQIRSADVVIGSFGKRSRIDHHLGRSFISRRSPFAAVKYHVRLPHDRNLISLHNFHGGYCGMSCVEDDKVNICYLIHRDNLRAHGNITRMEEAVLFRNPHIRSVFNQAEFLFSKPETITEISFETKGPLDSHILMTGDAAGMITPLCGNGMAMAIHAAKILAPQVIAFCSDRGISREELERRYTQEWMGLFRRRLWTGRQLQRLFGSEFSSNLAVYIANNVKPLATRLVNMTHGQPF